MIELPSLTAAEFRRLCDFLYRRTGIAVADNKRYYVERRVRDRMIATGTTSFAAYFVGLRGNADGEIEKFVNSFTVNETYFYREDQMLRCLSTELLHRAIAAKAGTGPLRIWSIPCSSGEEPYSIAIWLLENWPQVDDYDIEIVGSDIDTRILEEARSGIYGPRALMRLSPQVIAKYFEPLAEDRWRLIADLRQSVQFSQANVIEAAETRPHGRFDVIFCRNMLIYFDDASRRVAAENLYECLMPGGYICLSQTESMSRISPLFEVCRFADAVVYRRPIAGGHG